MKVFVDLNHFNVIIRNLINNAIKFTPIDGKIWINGISESKNLKIMIKDTGVGISYETIQKIMDNTVNYSTYGTSMEKGTGLGLQLCMEMASRNDGNIFVESKENEGTTFSVILPIGPMKTENRDS